MFTPSALSESRIAWPASSRPSVAGGIVRVGPGIPRQIRHRPCLAQRMADEVVVEQVAVGPDGCLADDAELVAVGVLGQLDVLPVT